MRKSYHHLLKELPQTVEHKLHLLDPAVAAFVQQLAGTEDDQIYSVIDQMLVFYAKREALYRKELDEYLQYGVKPEDMPKLVSAYLKLIEKK